MNDNTALTGNLVERWYTFKCGVNIAINKSKNAICICSVLPRIFLRPVRFLVLKSLDIVMFYNGSVTSLFSLLAHPMKIA